MLRLLIAALLFLLSASLAQAAVCTIQVSDLNFGTVDTLGTPAPSTANIAIDCDDISDGTGAITVCGSIGEGSGGAVGGMRRSLSTEGSLGFELYAAPGQTSRWGNWDTPALGEPQRISIPVTGDSASLDVELYGTIAAGQSTAPVGDYRADFAPSEVVFTYAEGNDLDCAAPVGTDVLVPFSVLATVPANCLLETSDLDFGTAGVIGTNIDADTSFDLTCTSGTDYTISIDGGGAGDPAHRLLKSGGNTVSYDLYSNAERSAPWGTDIGRTVSGDGDGTLQIYDVYGRIPPQPAAAGAYTDTVVVTIAY